MTSEWIRHAIALPIWLAILVLTVAFIVKVIYAIYLWIRAKGN